MARVMSLLREQNPVCVYILLEYIKKMCFYNFELFFYEQQHLFDFASSEVSGCDPQSADTSPGGPREPPKPRAAVPPT